VSTVGALLEIVLCVAAAVLLMPQAIVFCETLGALLPRPRSRQPIVGQAPRTAVLVPAHDEASQIEVTVRCLLADIAVGDRVIVIADNCEDQTAAVARAAGATVVERVDPSRRGKGFAIAFALAHLDADPPDVVVLVDADCRVSKGGIPFLAGLSATLDRPVQAEYLIQSPPNPTPVAVVSALAVMIRNRVRPRGLNRFGLPCHLTGSGMAFPWQVLREAPGTGAELVEDLVMGIQMALTGHPPQFCPDVQVTSELPDNKDAAMSQRRRWEHGQLHTLVKYSPRLIGRGLLHGRLGLVGLGFDLVVPPLALLVMLQLGVLSLAVAAGAVGLTSFLPATLAGTGFAILATAIGAAWVTFGRKVAPLRYALFIPIYVLWKIPLYLSLVLRGKQKTWERTARRGEAEFSDGPRSSAQAGSDRANDVPRLP
jgi:cellulose synthase/poly-beta-1,6-N-acetylglucosamine synthase-like glycosyltransferase